MSVPKGLTKEADYDNEGGIAVGFEIFSIFNLPEEENDNDNGKRTQRNNDKGKE